MIKKMNKLIKYFEKFVISSLALLIGTITGGYYLLKKIAFAQ